MNILNTREIALVIWLGLAIGWCFTQPSLRKSFAEVIKCVFSRIILSALTLMTIYICLVVYLLQKIGLWDLGQLKNTLLWCIGVATVSLFRVNELSKETHFFSSAIKDSLKLIIVIEFIIDSFPFNLMTELVIVPTTFFMGAALALSKYDDKHRAADKILDNTLAIFGLIVVMHAGYKLIIDANLFFNIDTLQDFYTPILLSLLYLPFVYFMVIYCQYDTVFTRLNIFMKDPMLIRIAKIKSIQNFHFNWTKLNRWAKSLSFIKIESIEDINKSIYEINESIKRERNPIDVPFSEGWSPYKARQFLLSSAIVTDVYHSIGGEEWYAGSPYKNLSNDLLSNSVAYYIDGDKFVAKELKIVLDINTPNTAGQAHKEFLYIAKLLHRNSLNEEMLPAVEKSLMIGKNLTIIVKGKKVSVNKLKTTSTKHGRYSIEFLIKHVYQE